MTFPPNPHVDVVSDEKVLVDDPETIFEMLGSDKIEVDMDWENQLFVLTPADSTNSVPDAISLGDLNGGDDE